MKINNPKILEALEVEVKKVEVKIAINLLSTYETLQCNIGSAVSVIFGTVRQTHRHPVTFK